MFDKDIIVDSAMQDYGETREAVDEAVDLTLDAVVSLLRRKAKEHGDRGNKISALVVDDILKEFY